MNPKFLYLLLDLGSFIVPFAFSFHPKASFAAKWKFYLPGIFSTGIIFLIWDEYFTQQGHWGFNSAYTTGIYLGSLPLEEVLFFFCIPYACCFSYFALNHLLKNIEVRKTDLITLVLTITLLSVGLIFVERAYTAITFISLAIALAIEKYVLKENYLGRFYFTYILLLIPFFIVNGILTGSFIQEPVVWYNNNENLNVRIGTIPVEDVFYGMLMILLPIAIAKRLESASIKKALNEGSLNATK